MQTCETVTRAWELSFILLFLISRECSRPESLLPSSKVVLRYMCMLQVTEMRSPVEPVFADVKYMIRLFLRVNMY